MKNNSQTSILIYLFLFFGTLILEISREQNLKYKTWASLSPRKFLELTV